MTVAAAAPGDINAELRRIIGAGDEAPAAGGLLGVEHEFYLFRVGQALDFRSLIHGLAIDGRRLDPGDTNAYRCASGISITCDEAEAEFASPPIAVERGFVSELERWVRAGRDELRAAMPSDIEMVGASTHLSVAAPDALGDVVCFVLARAFAPALMMLLDRRDSFGIDIRPRVGRVELCGEYADGPRLVAVAAMLAGGVKACVAALERAGDAGGTRPGLPPLLRVRVDEATERYGFRVHRRSLGGDLYAEGRSALLARADGGEITAQRHLELTWEVARAALGEALSPEQAAFIEDVVAGRRPLGIEEASPSSADDELQPERDVPQSVFSSLVKGRERPRFSVRPRIVTWQFMVLELSRPGRSAFLCAPRMALQALLDALDGGELDGLVELYLNSPLSGRRLAGAATTRLPGFWDEIGVPAGLLAEEYELEQFAVGAVRRTLAVASLYARRDEQGLAGAEVSADGIQSSEAADAGTALSEEPDASARTVGDITANGRMVVLTEGDLTSAVINEAAEPASGKAEGGEAGAATEDPARTTAEAMWPASERTAMRRSEVRRGKLVPLPGERGDFGEEHHWGLWLAVLVTLTLVVGGVLSRTLLRADETASVATPEATLVEETAVTAPSPTLPPVSASPEATVTEVAPTPSTPVLSGDYDVRLLVERNPGNHPADLLGVTALNALITRDRSIEPNPVRIELQLAGVTLAGAAEIGPTFGSSGGTFTTTAAAPYRGFSTTWVFEGSVVAGQGLSGTLTIGGDGRLPGGQPIVYRVEGTRR